MPYIDLDRRFSKWNDNDAREDDFHLFERSFIGEVTWPELLKHQRVVLLAEAGSGKSRELEEQAKRLQRQGEFAFHATVQNVAREGLAESLDMAAREQLNVWLNAEVSGWFFIDSVDEAKLDHIRFADALRKLGNGVGNGLPRARIVLSGRYSDWEFRADLRRLKDILPIAERTEEAAEAPNEILSSILQNKIRQRSRDKELEKPVVVLMAPLDQRQVGRFAEGQGVQEVDAFMEALEAANLWHFAKRPLDLGWLVDFWQKNRRFGRFADMLEASIRARLVEFNPERGLQDKLNVDSSFSALERIGATMVFGRKELIQIPDTEVYLGKSKALNLCDVLPDWATEHIPKLLTRPVFDPASLGQVRLHNDNKGVVRGFLASRWLKKRRDENAPISKIFELLFGDAEGTPIVLRSVHQTAAWLSIWDSDVANEVIRREPSLLLTAGDPSCLSAEIRQAALKGVIHELALGVDRHEQFDHDTLRRFSTSDMISTIREAWSAFSENIEIRHLLLSMIWLGRLSDVADIARTAVSDAYDDLTTTVFGIRALAVTGTAADLRVLSERIAAEAGSADDMVIWEALDVLFPQYTSVKTFLGIIRTLSQNGDASKNFRWRGKMLIERLTSRSDLKELLGELLQIGAAEGGDEDDLDESASDEKRLLPLIQSAASALLRRTPRRKMEALLVEAAIRLSGRFGERNFEDKEFQPMLLATPERRRFGLWRAVEILEDHSRQGEGALNNLWQLEIAGWSAGLLTEDFPWLLEDARHASTPVQQRLALDALLSMWQAGGKSESVLAQIKNAAGASQEASRYIEQRLLPRERSSEEIAQFRKMDRLKEKTQAERKKRDQSWIEFVENLKSDPQQLRTPPHNLKPGNVDARLFYLWELLCSATTENTHYAVDDFGALAAVLGPEVTREATEAFIKFWRGHCPTLVSSRKAEERNQINKLDCMGIVGVSLEARANPDWVDDLTAQEATTAAQLATLELNGFPHWFSLLAKSWPDEVRIVLECEIKDHLAHAPEQHGFLNKLEYVDLEIVRLVSAFLVKFMEERPNLSEGPLSKLFNIISRVLPNAEAPASFLQMMVGRFIDSERPSVAAYYLGFTFRIDPSAGVAALSTKLDRLPFVDQKVLVEQVLPVVFGDRWGKGGMDPSLLPFQALERLVNIAFHIIRLQDDAVHEGVYAPDIRDRAEGARSNLFKQLVETPGRGTVEALRRLAADRDCDLSEDRLAELMYERASKDAEREAWPAGEAFQLEKEFDMAPQTPRGLQLAGIGRIEDINHDLHHHRFAQGHTVKRLQNEREIQKWLAHELDQRNGRAYSLEREPHVVDEKEPDVSIQSRVTEASLPIEIKVAESWSLIELEEALTTQLAGRYLRERDQRHGLFLLIHQKPRPKGWQDGAGKFLSFKDVVERLRALAYRIGAGGADAARVEVVVIDVSDIQLPEKEVSA